MAAEFEIKFTGLSGHQRWGETNANHAGNQSPDYISGNTMNMAEISQDPSKLHRQEKYVPILSWIQADILRYMLNLYQQQYEGTSVIDFDQI